jgi:hypothetical protein
MEVFAIISALIVVAIAYALYEFFAPVGWKQLGKARS